MEVDFSENYITENTDVRNSSLQVWDDLFLYASNLRGNWLLSKEIFYKNLLPTAEKDPALFAESVANMVQTSGLKIKYDSTYKKSLNLLRKFRRFRKDKKNFIKRVLTGLFLSGLNEPLYAQSALNKLKKQ